MPLLVLLESPFAGNVDRNVAYARACMRDCFLRGEYPFASHLLFTQPGVLDDQVPDERRLGIEAGLAWGQWAAKTVIYTDLGISPGMELGIARAQVVGRPVEMRTLAGWAERPASGLADRDNPALLALVEAWTDWRHG